MKWTYGGVHQSTIDLPQKRLSESPKPTLFQHPVSLSVSPSNKKAQLGVSIFNNDFNMVSRI
jgi:hypothetical protein